VAVDYPLDDIALRDAAKPDRRALLQRAASLAFVPGSVSVQSEELRFQVSLTNSGTGHNLPGGFAFVRQMWLEVSVLDEAGRLIASSGRLAKASDDLCDSSIIGDSESSMRKFIVGCQAVDRELVTFQQMLVDKVEPLRDATAKILLDRRGQPLLRRAPGGREVAIQYLTGGPVTRQRASTGEPMPPLVAGETRTIAYRLSLGGERPAALRVRLLFRALPPYFLRALAERQQPGDGPNLLPLVANVEVDEMIAIEAKLTP
jgi:hypothetical protein